jgi:ribosomal RNA assembly protein
MLNSRRLFYFSLEKYLQEVWPMVKTALKEFGVACELNLVRNLPVFSF